MPTATPTPEGGVTVYGDLPVNATLVWERVESMLGGEYDEPTVAVTDAGLVGQTDSFAAHLGLSAGKERFRAGQVGGSYRHRPEQVRIVPRNGSDAQIARVLAHEYVHAIQYQTEFVNRSSTREGFWISWSLIEGSASYVADAYAREYLGFSSLDRRCERYREGSPYARYVDQIYCPGGRYFDQTLESPNALLSPNTTLPNTTEQLLHPGTNDPPANLTVVDETPIDWSTPSAFDREGELFVRTVLGTELREDRAIEAADGWGNDRVVRVSRETEGYVWVLRWDTAADATEFETAFADYLDALGNRTSEVWTAGDERYRLSTVDNRTVAVVTGNESFVDAVSVTEREGNVTVSGGDRYRE